MGIGVVKIPAVMRDFRGELLVKALECRKVLCDVLNVRPGLIRKPIRSWIWIAFHSAGRTSQQESVLELIDLVARPQKRNAEAEREHQLVRLEQTTADVVVEGISEIFDQVVQSLIQIFTGLRIVNAGQEQIVEPLQTVLVHRVHHRQAGHAEEQCTAVECDRAIFTSGLVNDHFRLFGFGHFQIDFFRLHFTPFQSNNEVLLLKDITFSFL
mmetsp:Transcript_35919/g.60023  ORF Transcript_35919/g.60023 Transcript_35919/m.60023 type:complete len:212 (+) Transcript_35919:1925-2560(+)